MPVKDINNILDQKQIILTDIYNISKKAELCIKQDNAENIAAILDKREDLIERVLKCDPAIKNIITNEKNEFSSEKQKRLEEILSDKIASQDELSEEEKELYDKVQKNSKLLKRISTINNSLERMVKNEYEKTKKQLSENRKANEKIDTNNMFR